MTSNNPAPHRSIRLTARQGRWDLLGTACRQIRTKVFIEEQHIPQHEEWDELDPVCEHFLLLINDRPVATARLTPEGRIGRLAVLAPARGKGLGEKILQRVLEHCRRNGFKKVTLNAQLTALNLYLKLGFSICGDEFLEVGIPHVPMQLELASELQADTQLDLAGLQQALQTTGQYRIQGHDQLKQCISLLIQSARRSFTMETPVYMDQWFDEATLTPLLSLGRRHTHSKVQWLLGETRQFSRQGGALLKLHQRAPSHIEIQQAHNLYRADQQAFLLVDNQHLLWWPHYREPRAELYTAGHRETLRAAQSFKLNWEKSARVKSLQNQNL